MIAYVKGVVTERTQTGVVIDVGGISYEVLVPPIVMQALEGTPSRDDPVRLVTYHYIQMDQNRAVPVLIGFSSDVEKEFFEHFITVSGVGPRAACRAFSLPFSLIADAIDKSDIALLKTLPGIGERRAREIVAKLQGKVGKFCLIQDRSQQPMSAVHEDVKDEAITLLIKLQYKKHEAMEMVEKAFKRNPAIKTCEDILNEVYRGVKTS